MGNYHPILMKVGTETNQNMLSLNVIKAEAYAKKTAKIKCKNDFVSNRQRCMSA
jgi:hypothetical protein